MNLKLEQQTMSPEEGAASADSNDANPEGASTDLQAENTRLRQENARHKQVQKDALPYVQVAVELGKATGGKEIIAKLEKQRTEGVPADLTQAELKKVETAAAAVGAVGVTKEELTQALTDFEQKNYDRENAREANRRIQEQCLEELPGYESLYQTPQWSRRRAVLVNQVQADPSLVDDEPNPFLWIEKEVYAMFAAQNPEIGKVKRVGKKESERRGAITGVSQKSGGAPEETEDNLPDYVKNLRDRDKRGKTLATHYSRGK